MTVRPTAAVLEYGAGNVRSARRGFDVAGADATITGDPAAARRADVLVIPGVGHFSACLAHMRGSGLVEVLDDAIAGGRPVFGICVGMQLLYRRSEEGDEPGLALLPGVVERFPTGAVVPHMGWDVVHADGTSADDPLLDGVDGQRLYFAHSYYAVPESAPHVVGRTDYGGVSFPSVVREGSVVGVQFHPEKSGPVGVRLLRNWLAGLR